MKTTLTTIMLSLTLLGAGCVQAPTDLPSPGAGSPDTASVGRVDTEVDLSGQGLRKVPDDILAREDVTSLDLSHNELEGALPAEIRNMRSLRTLDVSGNRMTGVPAEVGQLRELRVLDLSDNRLTGLPYELGNLQRLEVLDVSGNAYSEQDLSRIQSELPATTVIRR